MKKLKLSSLQFGSKELLTREQLKTIMGGDGAETGSGSTAKICATSSDCLPLTYTCTHDDGSVTGPYSTGQGGCRWETWNSYGRCFYGFVCQP